MPAITWIRFTAATSATGVATATTCKTLEQHIQEIIYASSKDGTHNQSWCNRKYQQTDYIINNILHNFTSPFFCITLSHTSSQIYASSAEPYRFAEHSLLNADTLSSCDDHNPEKHENQWTLPVPATMYG